MPEQEVHPLRLAFTERDLDAAGILSRKTRYRMRRQRTFPEPVVAGGRRLYRASDIHAWLQDPERWVREHSSGDGCDGS